ncbi:DUF1329 domain-containing protein [Algiphilus sp.]|uniref:DUF1329 domain-containing protein n=1 Tax=Algiphilus sp. TaxID=1872431 RepID=UPI003B51AAB0
MTLRRLTIALAAGAAWALSAPALAAVSQEEANKLGTELTPVGANPKGNEDGTIPEWNPTTMQGDKTGEYPSHPEIDDDEPRFVITAENMDQYADKLSEGHKLLLQRYPDSYKMKIYPSHRIVTWPEEILAATKRNATACEFRGPDDITNCEVGFPFPIPQTGAEVVWNHKLKWRGNNARRYNNQMIVQQNGDYQFTKIVEDVTFSYANLNDPVPIKDGQGEYLRYLSETVAPVRLAGTFILVHEKVGTGEAGRRAWLYSPGLRRIRRAPSVCCDNPYEGTDGHQFYDQVDMFNGVLERFNWKLLGKKEMFIPYNSHKIAGPPTKYADLAQPRHLNQELPRYELHRVWVVEAENKPDLRHTFGKKVLYIDEDSWNIVMIDNYDHRGEMMQFQEGHYFISRNILAGATSPEVIYHLNTGRYFLTALAQEDQPIDSTVTYDDGYFTAAAVQRKTSR